jgi:hypothetical protein
MADLKTIITKSLKCAWQAELMQRLNEVISIAKAALIDTQSHDNPVLLQSLIDGVERISLQVSSGTLMPPDGQISLGIGRFESDWVDDLGGSLSEAVAAAEKHDRKGLRYDITSFGI